MEVPNGGVDMQSDNACACFVRVGRCRFGSILCSILESFGGPSSLLYSFWVARVAKQAHKREAKQKNRKLMKTDLTRAYGELQLTGPGAPETVKLSDNETVQLSLQYWAPETLHLVLKARWRIYMCVSLDTHLALVYISATVPQARSGVFLGPSTVVTVGQSDCLTILTVYRAPGPISCISS